MRPEEVFPFKHLARTLDSFQVPAGPFDPQGSWAAGFDLVERGFRTNSLGTLFLARTAAGTGRARLRYALRRRGGGGIMRAEGEVQCATDALSSPLTWTVATWAEKPDGTEIPDSRLAERLEVHGQGLRVQGEGRERRLAVDPPLALDWCLFDAVQRLPRQPRPDLRFALLDRLGASAKPGQVLAFRQSVSLALGGRRAWAEEAEPLEAGTRFRPVERLEGATEMGLHAFEHWGTGVLPTTYWVSDRGQLLFVLSGMSGWIWNPQVQA